MKKTFTNVALGLLFITGTAISANAQLTWQTLDLDNLSTTPVEVSSITQVDQVLYKIQPTADGTLYVTQTKSGDSHIYSDEELTQMVTYPAFDPGIPDSNVYSCTYYLDGGETYYFRAKENEYDDISAVSFTNWVVDTSVPPTLPLNQVIEVEASISDSGTGTVYVYQPESDGTLEFYTSNQGTYVFSNKGHSKQLKAYETQYGLEAANGLSTLYKYAVEAGESYYVYAEIDWLTTYSFMAVYSPEIFVLGVTVEPEEGAYNYGRYNDIILTGTAALTVESITLKYGTESKELKGFIYGAGDDQSNIGYEYQISGSMDNVLQVKMVDTGLINTILNAGENSFTLEFNNLTCGGEQLGENGVYTLTYTLPAEFKLDSADWPTNFYTYWAPGNETGIFTITFTSEVGQVGEVNAIPGTFTPGSTSGSQVSFPLAAEINPENPNQIIVNMTGIDFAAELEKWNTENENDDPEWSPESFKGTMSIVLMDIQSAEGLTYFDGEYALLYHTGITMNQTAAPGDELPTYMTATPTVDPAENTEDEPYAELDEVTISWGETVKVVENQTLTVNVALGNGSAVSVPAEIVNGDVVANLTSAYPENADYTGLVTVSMPGIMVQNEAGEFNNPVSFKFYVALIVDNAENPEGKISPELGFIYTEGETVTVSLVFEEGTTVEQGPVADPVIVNNGTSDSIYTWSSANVLSIDAANSTLNVNLGELPVGSYIVNINIGAVLVDGIENAAASTVFKVEVDTEGISSIEAELQNGNVYNLQGMKVNANNLKPGVYVVNGKKVLVK